MEQHAALQMAAGGEQLGAVLREADRLALDAIENSFGQNDLIALYLAQRMELHRHRVSVTLRHQRYRLSSIDIARAHGGAQLAKGALGGGGITCHHVQTNLGERAR